MLIIYILPISLIACIFLFRNGFSLNKKVTPIQDAKIQAYKKELQDNEKNIISKNISEGDEQYYLNKIQSTIDYCIGRHDWYETQRGKIFTLTLWAIGISVTLWSIGLDSKRITSDHFNYSIIISILISLIFATLEYLIELDNHRSYRLLADIRFWFFKYNFSSKNKSDKDDIKIKKAKNVKNQRFEFMNRLKENFSKENSIREDLEQIFILQILQNSKHQSLKRLKNILAFSLIIFALHLVFLLCQN